MTAPERSWARDGATGFAYGCGAVLALVAVGCAALVALAVALAALA